MIQMLLLKSNVSQKRRKKKVMTLKNSSVIQKLELKNPSNLLALSFLSTKKDLQIVLEKFNPRKSLRICSRRMEDARSLDSP